MPLFANCQSLGRGGELAAPFDLASVGLILYSSSRVDSAIHDHTKPLLGWGWNFNSQLGNNTTINSVRPVAVFGLGGDD
jgi:hypothetical protein